MRGGLRDRKSLCWNIEFSPEGVVPLGYWAQIGAPGFYTASAFVIASSHNQLLQNSHFELDYGIIDKSTKACFF